MSLEKGAKEGSRLELGKMEIHLYDDLERMAGTGHLFREVTGRDF